MIAAVAGTEPLCGTRRGEIVQMPGVMIGGATHQFNLGALPVAFEQTKQARLERFLCLFRAPPGERSEEHTSELQSLMRISYAVFCLKKKTNAYCRARQKLTHKTYHSNNTHTN